jgi:hypothetical protein
MNAISRAVPCQICVHTAGQGIIHDGVIDENTHPELTPCGGITGDDGLNDEPDDQVRNQASPLGSRELIVTAEWIHCATKQLK